MRHILSAPGDYLQNREKVNAARQSKPSRFVSPSYETPESNLSTRNDDKGMHANCDDHLAKSVECLTNRYHFLPNCQRSPHQSSDSRTQGPALNEAHGLPAAIVLSEEQLLQLYI
jgi:hypothetical protein